MASSDNFFGDASRLAGNARDPREAVIARELENVREPALAAALETFALLKLLPRAFADSQRRELRRVQASDEDGKDSPRVQSLLQSIEQADTLRGTSEVGLARVERMLSLQDSDAQLVHGFVSDSQLRPLSKLRVQLQLDNDKPRSASTGEDGYFRIELGERTSKPDAGRLAAMLARGRAKVDAKNAQANAAAAAAAAASDGPAGRLAIFAANGTLLYADPDALALDAGHVYREYVISGEPADRDAPPPKGSRGAAEQRAAGAQTANQAKAAAATSRGSGATGPATPPAPTGEAKPAAAAGTKSTAASPSAAAADDANAKAARSHATSAASASSAATGATPGAGTATKKSATATTPKATASAAKPSPRSSGRPDPSKPAARRKAGPKSGKR